MGYCWTGEALRVYTMRPSPCTKMNSRISSFVHIVLQERFMSLHPGFYHNAHAAILVFDVTRKSTYKNLSVWYKELRQYRSQIPVIVLANKIDENPKATEMQFNFAKKNNLEMNYSSGKYIFMFSYDCELPSLVQSSYKYICNWNVDLILMSKVYFYDRLNYSFITSPSSA